MLNGISINLLIFFCLDTGGEYTSQKFQIYFQNFGIIHQFSSLHTHEKMI